jgi:hypothetical protein
MYNIVGFYNSYGNGDIFESREFVRDAMKLLPAKNYVYYTGKSSRILMDIPGLGAISSGVPAVLDSMKPYILDKENNNLFVNSWIGRDSKYVLSGIGCTVEGLHRMWNDILKDFGVELSSSNPLDYITQYNYTQYSGIPQTLVFTGMLKEIKKVFISNGDVHSKQADNFSMIPMIEELAWRFPETLFFVSQKFPTTCENIIDANQFSNSELDSNLVELSFLSTFCDVTIGRNSGAHVFSWVRENCFRPMTNITFSHQETGSHFVRSDIPQLRYWHGGNNVPQLTKWAGNILERVL